MTDDQRDHDCLPSASSALMRDALVRAQELVESKPVGAYSLPWCVEALHVGDMSVLALDSDARAKVFASHPVNSS